MEIKLKENILNILTTEIDKPTLINLKINLKLKNRFIRRYKEDL